MLFVRKSIISLKIRINSPFWLILIMMIQKLWTFPSYIFWTSVIFHGSVPNSEHSWHFVMTFLPCHPDTLNKCVTSPLNAIFDVFYHENHPLLTLLNLFCKKSSIVSQKLMSRCSSILRHRNSSKRESF